MFFPGLFYDGIGNDIGAEMSLIESHKLNQAAAAATMSEVSEAEEGPPDIPSEPDVQAASDATITQKGTGESKEAVLDGDAGSQGRFSIIDSNSVVRFA